MMYLRCTYLVILAFLTSFCSSAQGSIDALDEKNGFKDAKFGAPLSSFTGLTPIINNSSPADYKRFIKKGESNKLGDVPIENLEYTFYQDKVIEVQFSVNDRNNCEQVLQALQLAYGPGQTSIIGRQWEGKIVRMNFMSGKDSETGLPTALVTINSKKMYEEIKASRENKSSDKIKSISRDL